MAAANAEQATGLREVNAAVNQMDQVTQQNAAMVEQATAASHSLAAEADALSRLVGQFQIGAETGAREARGTIETAPHGGLSASTRRIGADSFMV
jgi:methyl-accepting chemotaxis protein